MFRFMMIFVMVLINVGPFAQAPDTMWTKTFGGDSTDWARSVQQTSDGGYIIVGTTFSFSAVRNDVWLIKTDANGDTLWTRTYGDSGFDYGYSVQETSDGGYIIAGTELIKTDANGDTMWTSPYGGISVDTTSDGGYITTYPTPSSPKGLVKTDASGDTLWTKPYGGYSVQQTSDGGYIITGGPIPATAGIALIKTDASGDTLWTKSFWLGGMSIGYSVKQTTDGGYIIAGACGFTPPGSDPWDVCLVKTDVDGDTMWAKILVWGHPFGGAVGYSVAQTIDGGYIVTGYRGGDLFLIKTDASGNTLWIKFLGGSFGAVGYSVQQTTDGGYIITGLKESSGPDLWLIKIAPDVTTIDEAPQSVIKNYQLRQNYPNPFNPTTAIAYQLPRQSDVRIEIYNMLGQKVRTLLNDRKEPGAYRVIWDGRNDKGAHVGSGVYLYRMQAGDFVQTRKMILMR